MRNSALHVAPCGGAQAPSRSKPHKLVVVLLLAALAVSPGCAAVTNPVANGIPVRKVPPELLGESRQDLEQTPLTVLQRPQPDNNNKLIGPGDVLGIWIEGVLGEKGQAPFVRVPETGRQTPTLGYPIPVRGDGTISLPLVPPIEVKGLTLEEAEAKIRKVYTIDRGILKPGQERIVVTMQKWRDYHILVIRQDTQMETQPAGAGATGTRATGFILNIGGGGRGARRGTGFSIDLPAYENDVLNALARTGGMPGTDAVDEVIIEKGSFAGQAGRDNFIDAFRNCPPGTNPFTMDHSGSRRIRIPLRYHPGMPPHVNPEDVILETGDIVYIEAREADVFYAAGLLPSGEYTLPRDTDLDVVQACLRIGGPIFSSGLQTANITGTIINPGFGFLSPTLLSVIRQTPCGGQFVIRVDLDRAFRDPRERILVQPRDVLLLQETPEEAIARYFYETVNQFSFFHTSSHNGVTVTGPTP
jgi:Polysaccharide biosynthesis/export protein